jgi:hypothetical protein
MKKVIKAAVKEVSEHRSDFSHKKFELGLPEARVIMDFGYGSIHDGAKIEIDLFDDEAVEVVDFLAGKLCEEARRVIISKMRALEGGIDDAVAARDWQDAETLYASTAILKRLAGEEASETAH